MKKTLSLILALLMSASCAATIFADEAAATSAIEEEVPAEEVVVEEETEYDLAVKFLEYKKIMQGKGDGLLHVEDAVKRYEMAVFAGRIATGWVKSTDWENGTDDRTQFTDLEGSGAKDSYGILSYVAEKDIIKGYPDGTFKPEATVTYRDALAIVVRTLGYTGLEYPWGIIEKAVTLGLTEDITGVAYTDTINRGVAAQIIYNALFNATTAKGTKLAMDSFDVEYGWENILVVADDKAIYEAQGKATKAGKGIVSFKLVEDNGELSDDVYYVHADLDEDKVADLAFGKFYNALFEIDEDDELVDMIGAIEYEAEYYYNKGITDDEKVAIKGEIADYLKNYTILDKYNVKNLSKETLYNDEIIVVSESDKIEIVTGKDYSKSSGYAINWETGDILKINKDANGKVTYTTEWHYNEMYDLYFKWDKGTDIITDNDGNDTEIAGIQIMSEKQWAELKDAIAKAYDKVENFTGYTLTTSGFDTAYATLAVYDFDEDGMGDYAQFEDYSFGTFELVADYADACGDHANAAVKLAGTPYTFEGSCSHYSVGGDKYANSYVWAEGFAPSADFTKGYAIFGVDKAANTLKIVKEIPEFGKNTDADSYIATGIVRGLDASGKAVIIGNDKLYFDYDALDGTLFPKAGDKAKEYVTEMFNSKFNQFVEYVVVDGKLVKIDITTGGGSNYIVVEDYYGIDSDGYIVVRGYTTNDLALKNFRIGAYDGWKTGSGFFYNEEELEEAFTKGTVYKITSRDYTEKNGDVYYVTSLGAKTNTGEIDVSGVAAANQNVKITFEDNYRLINNAAPKKMSADDKYIIIANAEKKTANYMPIFYYKGVVDADMNWWVEGDLLVKEDHLFIVVNAECEGFYKDTTKTGYVAFPEKVTYKTVVFDGYDSEYYVYGATTYVTEGFDLLTASTVEVKAGLNLDLDAGKIYTTIDGVIVDDDDNLNWNEFWDDVRYAYAADKDNDADYLFKKYYVAPSAVEADIAKLISVDPVMLGLKREHDDVIGDYVAKQITLDSSKNLTKVEDYKNDVASTVQTIAAYVIFRTSDSKTFVYFNKADKNEKITAADTKGFANKIEVTTNDSPVYKTEINGKVTVDTETQNGTLVKATINTIEFAWGAAGNDASDDTLRSVLTRGLHFGRKGETLHENWATLVNGNRVYGTIVADPYEITEEFESDLAEDVYAAIATAVKSVKFTDIKDANGNAIVVEAGKPATVTISFVDSFGLTNVTWNFKVNVAIVDGAVQATFVKDACTANNGLNFLVK